MVIKTMFPIATDDGAAEDRGAGLALISRGFALPLKIVVGLPQLRGLASSFETPPSQAQHRNSGVHDIKPRTRNDLNTIVTQQILEARSCNI